MIIVVLVAFGLILGSFVNALVWRFHEQAGLAETGHKKGKPTKAELSMVKGRSMCSKCHHELAPKDLVPLFSWVWLRGKCRYCRKPIEDSPLLEAGLPILFVVSYLSWPLAMHGEGLFTFVAWLVFLVGFVALAAYDLRWYLLPNRIVFPLIVLAVAQVICQIVLFDASPKILIDAAWGVVIASGIFYVLYQISDGSWIGGGDVKLGIVLGILAGGAFNAMLLLFIASLVGTLVALPQVLRGKSGKATKIPFGPYLLLGAFIVVLYGDRMVTAYYNMFGLA